MAKTLLVGIDAACWEYLAPLLESGVMPTLQRLMALGAWGRLNSTMPPWTPTAWASIITGKNPGKHGIFDMLWRRPGSYEFTPTNSRSRRGTPFWDYLNRDGIRVGLVNIPFTYPPDEIDGFVVCGFGTPGSAQDIAVPIQSLQWIRTKFPDFKPSVEADFLLNAPPEAVLEEETNHQAQQVEIALHLAETQNVDVLAINLMLTDHANHKLPNMEQVQEAYRRADGHLDRLIEGFQPENVLLISDHGSSRLKGDFLLNAWLRDRGYIVYRENSRIEKKAALNWILIEWLEDHLGIKGIIEKILRRIIREGFLYVPTGWFDKFLDYLNGIVPFAREHVIFSNQVDHENTKVFPGSVYSGLLYLNLIGREPSGIVPVQEKQIVINQLVEELREIKEPDSGKPLFSNVYTSDEIYNGSAIGFAPDIVLDSYDTNWNIRTSKHIPVKEKAKNRYFLDVATRSDYGWHSREGIFIVTGPSILGGVEGSTAQIYDITATLLKIMGVSIPGDYDGRVLSEFLLPVNGKNEVLYQLGDVDGESIGESSLTEQESEELADHLRALGYLD